MQYHADCYVDKLGTYCCYNMTSADAQASCQVTHSTDAGHDLFCSWLAAKAAAERVVGWCHNRLLALWRRLPFWLRSRLWQHPPAPPADHASPAVARMLAPAEQSDLARLEEAGFNARGAAIVN